MCLMNAFHNSAIDRPPPQTPHSRKKPSNGYVTCHSHKVFDKKESCTIVD